MFMIAPVAGEYYEGLETHRLQIMETGAGPAPEPLELDVYGPHGAFGERQLHEMHGQRARFLRSPGRYALRVARYEDFPDPTSGCDMDLTRLGPRWVSGEEWSYTSGEFGHLVDASERGNNVDGSERVNVVCHLDGEDEVVPLEEFVSIRDREAVYDPQSRTWQWSDVPEDE